MYSSDSEQTKERLQISFLINEEKSKKGAGGHVTYVHPKCQSSN